MYEPVIDNDCPEGLELFPAYSMWMFPVVRPKLSRFPFKMSPNMMYSSLTGLSTLQEVVDAKPVACSPKSVKPVTEAKTCSAQLNSEQPKAQQINDENKLSVQEKWHPPVDLTHLEEKEQQTVRKMLYEESDVFAKDNGDIGCIDKLKLKISLKDDVPVQKCYNAIPKPQTLVQRSKKLCTESVASRMDR